MANGVNSGGKFESGNAGGPGNPYNRQISIFRRELFSAISVEDVREIVGTLVASAKKGNLASAKLVLSYAAGEPERIHDDKYVEDEKQSHAPTPPGEMLNMAVRMLNEPDDDMSHKLAHCLLQAIAMKLGWDLRHDASVETVKEFAALMASEME